MKAPGRDDGRNMVAARLQSERSSVTLRRCAGFVVGEQLGGGASALTRAADCLRDMVVKYSRRLALLDDTT
jgi:hypothetical protein